MTAGRIPSVEGGIQPTLLTTKGDLISATAASTVARLAVGTDYGFLQADSTQSTGLLWNNAAWTSYTPTVDASGGSGFTMSGVGYYTRVGKLCILNYTATVTTNGTGSGKIRMTLPFTARFVGNYASGTFRENVLTGKMGVAFLATSGIVSMSFYDDVYPGGTGASLQGFLVYEVA